MTTSVVLVILLGLAIACGLATVIKRNRAVAECVFLRTRIEALEKARLLAVSEWSTWKDVLVSNMTEADWRETMDGLRVPAALAAEETTTIYATTISDEDGNSLGDDAALAKEEKRP